MRSYLILTINATNWHSFVLIVNPDSLTDTEDTYKMPSKTFSTKECQFVALIVSQRHIEVERMCREGQGSMGGQVGL